MLYQWLRARRLDLAEGSVQDARRFLNGIDESLQALAQAK
jgi:hypothetical protein